jgi:hypothetical protein
MKLHAVYRRAAMLDCHDDTFSGTCVHTQALRHGLWVRDERVVTHRGHRLRQPLEQAGSIVIDRAGLAMHDTGRVHDLAPERVHDALMTKTHAQHRDFACELAQYGAAHAEVLRVFGPTGPG